VLGSRHSLRDAPAIIGPPVTEGVEGGTVVVVEGGFDFVVVAGDVVEEGVVAGGDVVLDGAVVAVVDGLVVVMPVGAPPPWPALVPAGVVVVAVAGAVLIGECRLLIPENSRLPVSFANFMRIAVLKEFGPRPTNDDVAEASTLIMATRRLVVTPRVTNFGIRCAVLAKKNF
jgi:hypothetical protein